ncbi:efflux transporter outer membrane subunit [Chitinimonas sp.]|uniref:efflux transporter outer membrane subunit n=1 Tax=Chitinimonas sp. TaxID=1934313 RepID=UPI002F946C9B
MRLIALPLLLALSACAMTPALVKPDAPIAATYPVALGAGREQAIGDLGWKTIFADPRLQRLIELALLNNRDLKLATLNAEAVQSQYRIARAARLPTVEAVGSASRQRIPANNEAMPAAGPSIQSQAGVNVGISAFEIDLFGRTRAESDAALERYLASEEGKRAAQITLVGAIADAYFAERVADEQFRLAEQTVRDWRDSLELTLQLQKAAQSSKLEIAQAEGQVASAEADLQARQRSLARARNALALLIGTEIPAGLPVPMALDETVVQTNLSAGLPSELLSRRPDILQAEHSLAAANADIGAARAAFFPRLSLTSSLGFASTSLGGLFSGDQRVWTFVPQISVPIFNAGRLRGELRLAELRKSVAVVEYERAIQIAFREVADGLAGRETYGRQVLAQAWVVRKAEQRTDLATQRYRAGVDGRLELLDSQRNLSAARQALLELRREEISNAIALYKSLGGGLQAKG